MRNLVILLVCLTYVSTSKAFESLPATVPAPVDNPTTMAKVELGKILFFDPRLSKTGTVSCNSCHNVMGAGEDGRPHSFGIEGKVGGRSAPTVWNSAFLSVQFWDGRAATLEDQAVGPITNPVEMGMENHAVAVARIREIPGYHPYFKKAFGEGEVITIGNIAKAIASYERTLITRNSPVDRYLRGDKKALSPAAIEGMKLVQTVGCVGCHSGPNYSGPNLPIGTGFFQKFPVFKDSEFDSRYQLSKDLGRFSVTKDEADRNVWRVPTLRNIALTAPYFHNGSVPTLDEAVRVMAKVQLDKSLKDSEVKAIVSFLQGLSGEFPEQKMPRLPATPVRSFDLN